MTSRFSAVADLLAVLAALGVALGVVFAASFDGVLRVATVLPTILFLPGYALVSALYPDRKGDPDERGDASVSLTGLERAGVAVAASAALVPVVALVSNFTAYGVRARPIVAGTAALTAVLVLIAAFRRFRLDPDRRYRVTGDRFGGFVSRYLTHSRPNFSERKPLEVRSNQQRLLNLLLAGAVVLFLSSVAYAAVGPPLPSQDGSYTELYLLDDSGDRLLGTEAPVSADGSVPFTVAVANHENEEQTYTVVVERQRATRSDNRTVVGNSTVVDTVSTTVADGETERLSQTVSGGENVRIRVLLYRGDPPGDPTAENAYRATRFWPSGST